MPFWSREMEKDPDLSTLCMDLVLQYFQEWCTPSGTTVVVQMAGSFWLLKSSHGPLHRGGPAVCLWSCGRSRAEIQALESLAWAPKAYLPCVTVDLCACGHQGQPHHTPSTPGKSQPPPLPTCLHLFSVSLPSKNHHQKKEKRIGR